MTGVGVVLDRDDVGAVRADRLGVSEERGEERRLIRGDPALDDHLPVAEEPGVRATRPPDGVAVVRRRDPGRQGRVRISRGRCRFDVPLEDDRVAASAQRQILVIDLDGGGTQQQPRHPFVPAAFRGWAADQRARDLIRVHRQVSVDEVVGAVDVVAGHACTDPSVAGGELDLLVCGAIEALHDHAAPLRSIELRQRRCVVLGAGANVQARVDVETDVRVVAGPHLESNPVHAGVEVVERQLLDQRLPGLDVVAVVVEALQVSRLDLAVPHVVLQRPPLAVPPLDAEVRP